MSYLNVRKIQTSRDDPYQSYECNPYFFYCYNTMPCGKTVGVPDLEIGKVSCRSTCPEQNMCVRPDRKECYIGKSSDGNDPLLAVYWDQKAPNLLCAYNLDHIDKVDQLRVYATKFKDTPYIDTMMGAFCGKKVFRDCAPGLQRDGKYHECSRYLTTNEEGKMCRDWLASLPRDRQDALMRNYCLSNDTLDCKCINRSTDPEYNKMKSLTNYFSDNCWYKPCSNSESIYLVPNRLTEGQCATNVCQQIIDAHAQGNITIEGNTSQINCNFKEGDIKQPPNSNPNTPKFDWLTNYWYVILGALAILLLLVI